MRIDLLTFGSRGDVQPALALGLGLKKAGYDVRMLGLEEYRTFVEQYGLAFAPLSADLQEILAKTSGDKLFQGTGIFELIKLFRVMVRTMFADLLEKCAGADALISNPATAMFADSIAEKLGIPQIETTVFPGWTTSAFPSFFGPWPVDWGRNRKDFAGRIIAKLNRFSYKPVEWILRLTLQPIIERCRVEILELPRKKPKQNSTPTPPILAGFSQHVLLAPTDWPENIHLTGYWFLDSPDYIPLAPLKSFLDAGPPPVYVGFGSMPSEDPKQTTELVLKALEISGQRGILLTGHKALGYGMTETPSATTAFFIDSVPHDWLLPRTAAVVHHGGAGTTAAGIRAGVPSIPIPIGADQRLWAFRLEQLGVAPKAIPRKKLTAENLAEAIQQAVSDKGMNQEAAALRNKIREEDGVLEAVTLIHRYLEAFRAPDDQSRS